MKPILLSILLAGTLSFVQGQELDAAIDNCSQVMVLSSKFSSDVQQLVAFTARGKGNTSGKVNALAKEADKTLKEMRKNRHFSSRNAILFVHDHQALKSVRSLERDLIRQDAQVFLRPRSQERDVSPHHKPQQESLPDK